MACDPGYINAGIETWESCSTSLCSGSSSLYRYMNYSKQTCVRPSPFDVYYDYQSQDTGLCCSQ